MKKEDVALGAYQARKPPNTPKPQVGLENKYLLADEVQWLTEQYLDRYGIEREYFGEMVVVNIPQTQFSDHAMIHFHSPISMKKLCSDCTPTQMLKKLGNERELPPRFKVCFMTYMARNEKDVNPFWFNIIFDFTRLTDSKLYDKLNITIMDPREKSSKEVLQIVASELEPHFSNSSMKQMVVPFCDTYTCGDHAARNGVHFSLFGNALEKIESIRNKFTKWCTVKVSLGTLEGLIYRLNYLQPDNAAVILRANQEMLRIIDLYTQHLTEKSKLLGPIPAGRSGRLGALLEIRSMIETEQSLNQARIDIETRFPNMYDCSDHKTSFMRQLVDTLIKLQRCFMIDTPKPDNDDGAVNYFN